MPFVRNNASTGFTLVEVTCALTIVAAVLASTFGLLGQLRKSQARNAAEVHAYGVARAALQDSRISGVACPVSVVSEPGGQIDVDAEVSVDSAAGLRTTRVSARVQDRNGRTHHVIDLSGLDLTPVAYAPQLPSDPAVTETGPSLQHITLSCDPAGGTVSGGGAYDHGTLVEIVATPEPGHTFISWSGATVSPNTATTHVLANEDKTLTATFSP